MHVYRDSASIRAAATEFPEFAEPLARRIEELSEYGDYELHELMNVVVAEPGDRIADLSGAVGFALEERHPDAMEAQPAWYELTYVVSDDGFGYVLYVPRRADMDVGVLTLCESLAGEGP